MAISVGTSEDRCIACHAAMQFAGAEPFRIGGTGGAWKLLFGEWAELGEEMTPFEIRVCTSCRRVELRVPLAK